MPIYEYRCEDCETKFEKLVRRSSDSADLACPSCGHNHVSQQLSTFAAPAKASDSGASATQCPGAGVCPNAGTCGMN